MTIYKNMLILIISIFLFFLFFYFFSNINIAEYYFLDNKGEANVVKIGLIKKSSNEEITLKKVLNNYLSLARKDSFNSELLSNFTIKDVNIQNNACIIHLELKLDRKVNLTSFSESRSLILLLKTAKSFLKNVKYFKIIGLEKVYKHIDTSYPMMLVGDNIKIVVGVINED
ncbi:MAG: hypothetical protein SVN78_00595 [Deferribacterota bacterium]|nr:hypothetical protein [Deferribacterota bacterium]